jgi:hypothetical protein
MQGEFDQQRHDFESMKLFGQFESCVRFRQLDCIRQSFVLSLSLKTSSSCANPKEILRNEEKPNDIQNNGI